MYAAADRHLLFGLLALQTGIINQGQLVAAFQAWTLDKSRSLADHLEDRGDLNKARRALLEGLVEVHLEAHGGEVEKSLAAVPTAKSTCESLANLGDPDIGATLGHVASGHGSTEDGDVDRTATYSVGTATSDGQRFRVLRPHARGGLGAVFVAMDGELHREVALKQILDSHADDPVSRQRFLIEAEITGGLEHPGVVPVYGLGTDAGGRPYYAMRFIKGNSLKEAIDAFHQRGHRDSPSPPRGVGARRAGEGAGGTIVSRSLELRTLLRRFTDVCNAVDYAHSRGVIHRDLKPANIIVGKHGETLVVDWGLAKAVGRSDPSAGEQTLAPSSGGSSETLPGSALGTPAYMSPEQARGELNRLGPRSDVYSLGATLYCLLTGKPPFEGEDLGEILRAVQEGQFPRPTQRAAKLDKALEAICLKAMATVPEERYATPRALADDLDRWMADVPVSAWREPLPRRARRRARRNRTAVTAASVALVAGVVGLVAVLAVQTRANADLAASLRRETTANTALTRSQAAVQARYNLAVEAIETFHTGVSEDFLLNQEQFKEVRDRLLKSASDFYGKLGALLGKESDLASRRALSQANYEVARLTGKVGKAEDSLAAHQQVLAARENLAAESQADPEIRADLARSLIAVAGLLQATGKINEAEATYRKAETVLDDPAPMIAEAAAVRAVLAKCRTNLGSLLSSTGRYDEALAVYRLARADQEVLAADPGARAESRRELADTISRVGALLDETGKLSEAEAEHRKALAICQKLADDNPAVTEFRNALTDSHFALGHVFWTEGKTSEYEAEFRKALAIQQKLADDNPAVTEFRSKLARAHSGVGWVLDNTGKSSEAEAEYRQALAISQKLADDNPAVTDFRLNLAYCHNSLGNLLRGMGKNSEAEAEIRKGLAIRQKLADDNPAITNFRNLFAVSHTALGSLLSDLGKSSQAEAEYRKALAIRQKLADDNPDVTDFRDRLAHIYNALGDLLHEQGKSSQAEVEYRAALVICQKLAEENPAVPSFHDTLAIIHINLGDLRLQNGDSPQGEAEYRKALAISQKLADDHPTVTEYQRQVARMLLRFGTQFAQAGRIGDAIDYCRREELIRKKLAGASSATPADLDWLANCQTYMADLLRRSGALGEALAACERALAVREPLVEAHPEVPSFRTGLAETYMRLGLVRCNLKDLTGAATFLRRASALYGSSERLAGEHMFFIACCHAGLSGLADRPGAAVSAAEGADQAEKSLARVRQAISMGYRSPDAYRTESAFDPLRDRDDFRLLMFDLAFPKDPFARGR